MAGLPNRLDGKLPQWDPSGVLLTRVDASRSSITLTGKEGTQLVNDTAANWRNAAPCMN